MATDTAMATDEVWKRCHVCGEICVHANYFKNGLGTERLVCDKCQYEALEAIAEPCDWLPWA